MYLTLFYNRYSLIDIKQIVYHIMYTNIVMKRYSKTLHGKLKILNYLQRGLS